MRFAVLFDFDSYLTGADIFWLEFGIVILSAHIYSLYRCVTERNDRFVLSLYGK